MAISKLLPRQDKAQLGIAMMMLAYLFFSLIDVSVKWMMMLGVPVMQLAFMRYFGHFSIAVARSIKDGSADFYVARPYISLVLLRSFLVVLATTLNFYALNFLSLTVKGSIMFSSPIVVCALSGPLLGERVGRWRWFAILMGFCGVLLVMRPFGAEFHWATLLIMHNAIAFGVFSIITRKLSGDVPAKTMQLYLGGLGTVTLLPLGIWTWQNPETFLGWAIMLSLGFWAWLGHEAFAHAHRFAAAHVLMPFTYSGLIYLAILGFLVFGSSPDSMTLLGAFIIVISGLIIWWRESLRND